jgi:hypothetical protein
MSTSTDQRRSAKINRDELKRFVYVTSVVTVTALFVLVWSLDSLRIGLGTLSRISPSITVTLLFWLFFFRWGWKWPGLRLIFNRPRIEGTWVGRLQSNWQVDGGTPDPTLLLPIVFVIRQTFSTLVIQSFTRKQEGLSDTASLVVRPESNTIYVAYTYALRREFVAGTGAQHGAAVLRLYGAEEMKGQYWTNTQTSGRVIVKRKARTLVPSFDEAAATWPENSTWPTFQH